MSESLVRNIYLGIGSNLGNRQKNIELAKFKLIQKDIKIHRSSKIYESLSWPNPDNPKFLNIIVEITSNLSPFKLIDICKKIEIDLGRKKRQKNAPRECDIDIIDYDNQKMKSKIILPHPRMHERNFVLFPLYELNKVWMHPILKQPIKKLILSLSNKDIRSIKQF